METKAISKSIPSWDDIIFSNRNKAYGAYILRQEQHKHEAFGLLISCTLLLSLSLLLHQSSNRTKTFQVPIIAPELVSPDLYQEQKLTSKSNTEQQRSTIKTPKAVNNETTPVPSAAAILPIEKDDSKSELNPNAGSAFGSDKADSLASEASANSSSSGEGTSNSLVLTPEEWPEFPGGQEGLTRYLSKKLKYTGEARREGVNGQVFVSFIVDATGQVTNIAIVRGLGFGLDEQVIHAIETMPKWKAGKHSGRNVPVQYNMPVRFSLRK